MFRQALILVLLLVIVRGDKSIFLKNVEHLLNTKSLTPKCLQSMEDMGKDAIITMLDASGKIPSGIQYGNFFEPGNFDECYNLESKKLESSSIGKSYGKYCLGTLQLPTDVPQYLEFNYLKNLTKYLKLGKWDPAPRIALDTDPRTLGYHTGICVPNQCTAEELSGIFYFTETYCYSKATTQLSLDTNATVGVSILSIFGLFIIVSTLFDIFLYYKQQKTPHDLLIAFSLLSNGKKLLSTTTNPDQLLCLNGIKAISMMWVIIGHLYSFTLNIPITNMSYIQEWMDDIANMFIFSATVSVDSFFVVGGIVAVYTFMKTMDKAPLKKFNIPLFYLHRYLRLTPALAAMILISATLLNYMGKGPMWGGIDTGMGVPCRDYWWSTLLYIQNYVNRDEQCVGQSWYLNVDMQIFLVLPLILVPLKLWPKQTLIGLHVLAVVGVIVPFAIAYDLKLSAFGINADGQDNWMDYYYIQPYARFGPYVIGMICGYYVHMLKKYGQKPKLHWMLVLVLWAVILSILVACLYASHDLITRLDDRWGNALYIAFNRNAWALALSGLIYLCIADYGGPINGFLSASIFQFISKISYSMYLVHIHVLMVWNFSKKSPMKFSNIQIMMDFWGVFMASVVCATVLCLVFESPVIIIEKCIFGRGAKKPKRKLDENKAEAGKS